ncbi:MAG: protein of unknown function (DUF1360) [Namikivirus tsukuho]|uniref:DUF1360 domain-containing protein n=1 Tax=Bacteriophage sp. TaxID=38018 RepID=A0ABY5TVR5_9VIRU|nr:MAG: protein of unknown function (DUF1360) [Bacteriophage sp.]
MKTEWWTAVITAGLTAGYTTTVSQLSPGPGNVFAKLRKKLATKTENATNETIHSFGNLAYCGWCLSPYTTLLAWAAVAKIHHIHFGPKWVAGWITATTIAAMYRHQAESRL